MRARSVVLLAAFALLSLGACDNFDLYTMLDGRPPSGDDGGGGGDVVPLALSVAEISLYAGGTYALSATGGVPPYQYSVSQGSGTIDASSGLYTAPAQPGTETVRVTDLVDSTSEATVHVLAPISFTISPSSVTLGVGTSITFTAAGGVPPIVFSIVSGSGTVDAGTGLYTAPAAPGTELVRATDAQGAQADATVSAVVTVGLAISPLAVSLYTDTQVDFEAFGGVSRTHSPWPRVADPWSPAPVRTRPPAARAPPWSA